MRNEFSTLSIADLTRTIGGVAGNTGITGGIKGINNRVPF